MPTQRRGGVRPRTLVMAFAVATGLGGCGQAAPSQGAARSLVLEKTIALPAVAGRIDHLAIDIEHLRLFVAELGNGSVEAIDLAKGQVAGRIGGLKEPQGLGYLPGRDELVVASGDGVVRFYKGGDLALAGALKLGDDADNVRIDPTTGHVVVGYGDGALATIDPAARTVRSIMPLGAHPEGFRLDPAHRRAFINLPGAGQIAVGDLDAGKVIDTRKAAHSAGYPLLFDPAANTVAVVYRFPARLVVADANTGRTLQDVGVCGDADDLFLDAKRQRVYVSCGSGEVDVLQASPQGYRRIDRIKTNSGARTSLFVPEIDRLFVAARASGGKPAAILVFRPDGAP